MGLRSNISLIDRYLYARAYAGKGLRHTRMCIDKQNRIESQKFGAMMGLQYSPLPREVIQLHGERQ
jgi:hypothetical protein